MNKNLICLAAISILSCHEPGSKENNSVSQEQRLTGEWNNLSISIEIRTKNNADSNEVFEVNRPQWEERLKIKPIRTFFRADSTWNSAHYNLKDSLVYNPSGKWWVEANKLTMLQILPSPDTTVYTFSIKNDTASFECMLDWDMDGKKDDKYTGMQIRRSK